jgi:hypothetical protein
VLIEGYYNGRDKAGWEEETRLKLPLTMRIR